jgi:DNA-binding CsgD family transcriptional regulator
VELLEREKPFAALEQAWASTRAQEGQLVFVAGEAGVGKTALVRDFCARAAGGERLLVGGCDGLRTPRPLAPFADVARTTGGRLEQAVAEGVSARAVFDALADELVGHVRTVLVLEDLHWSDEATLDTLGLLGRRVSQLGALVVVTYRNDELPRTHPLRIVLGDLATAGGVRRVQLDPLSPSAVAELAAPHGVNAEELHARTGGNPFFVTEVLATGGSEVPETIRDAVMARAARLTGAARNLLDAVAIVPQRSELALLEAVAGNESLAALEECLASGMLIAEEQAIAFRHELARIAVEESITPFRRVELNRSALQALRTSTRRDLARLAHHAEAADEAEAVLELAPAAAEAAAAVGAHREAAAQYARALRFFDRRASGERAFLLERRSYECYLTDDYQSAIAALEEALACYQATGDRRREGVGLCSLASRRWCASDIAGAEDAVVRAIDILEELGPSEELARAYATASSLAMNLEKAGPTLAWGERAQELIDEEGDLETFAYHLNTMGTLALLQGRRQGLEQLDRSIALAAAAGLGEQVGRGYMNIGWAASRLRDFALEDRLAHGIDYCSDQGLEGWRLYLIAYRSRFDLDRGRWTEAADSASFILGQPYRAPLLRLLSLTVLGTIRARRGDPDASPPLEQSCELAADKHDLQHLAPVAIARTEAASLDGDANLAARASDTALALALDRGAAWVAGELAFWRHRAGIAEPWPAGIAEPFALHLSGNLAAARAAWIEVGCPYEAALALADADDGDSIRHGIEELRTLGAGPAAAIAARRLRERGERGLPRGPRRTTRMNPAGLTRRELEVLLLVAEGLRNGEIAERLYLSERTVDHHVSAVLRKLSVRTRGHASSEATRLGLTRQVR